MHFKLRLKRFKKLGKPGKFGRMRLKSWKQKEQPIPLKIM